jgi:hypothetical protein
MTGNHIYEPAPVWLILVATATLGMTGLALMRGRGVVIGATLAIGSALVLGIGLFLWGGVVLPVAQIVALSGLAGALGAGDLAVRAFAERVGLRKDLELGAAVQTLLFPQDRAGVFEGWRYQLVFRPYGAMSGDWYQYYKTPPGASAPLAVLAIGDVVGKGSSAALATAMIAAVWASCSERWSAGDFDLQELVEALHRSLWRTYRGAQNSTLSLIVLRPESAELLTIGAPSWLDVRANGDVTPIIVPAMDPLGMGVGERVPVTRIREGSAQKGSLLTAYSDGVMEGGRARMAFARALKRQGALPDDPFPVVEKTMTDIGAGSVLPDDFTLLMVQRVD